MLDQKAAMLGMIGMLLALRRDKTGLMIFGGFLLLTAVATVIWNLIP